MANDVTIESISIEIKASAEAADKALEKLTNRLAALKAVTQGGLDGADKIAKGLKKLAEAAKSFESVDSEKLRNTLDALRSLQNVGNMPDISVFARSLKSLAQATSGINSADMSALAANMQSFVSAVQPLSGLSGIGDISNAVKALERLPKAAKGLSQMDMGTFAQQMQQAAAAIQPFAAQMSTLTSSMASLPEPIQRAVAGLLNFRQQSEQAAQSSRKLNKALNFANLTAFYFTTKKIVSVMSGFVNSSNAYVENLNLFTVTMGDAADEALNFANTVNEVMGIDVSQWIQNQGVFKQMVSGFGLVEEKANLVSKNLTQLGYDISSYFNISVEQAMLKLQSGISGELEPLRRIGYALDVATLQQVAYNHGIETSINSMTQAQKAQIRYIAIMEQSKNAMGDMARTIDSPANQLRILESRIDTLKRAIGDSLMPVLSAALPYVTAFVQILGEAFRDLAQFMGFELPVFDYSDLKKGGESIAASFDDATEAANKFKGTLAGIDQLNIIGSKTDTGAADMLGADLNLDLPSYDFLGDLKAETSEAYKVMKEFLGNIAPVASGIAIALGSMFVGDKVVSGLKSLAEGIDFMFNSPLGKLASTVAATATAFLGFKKIVKDLTTGNGSFKALALSIGGVVTAVGLFVATKNPLGAVLTVVGSLAGVVAGATQGAKQLAEEAYSLKAFDDVGISIGKVANMLSDFANEVTKSDQKILELKGSIDSNIGTMEGAFDTVFQLGEKFRVTGNMSETAAQQISTACETINQSVSQNLSNQIESVILGIGGSWDTVAQKAGMAKDEVLGAFYAAQAEGNIVLANLKQAMDEATSTLVTAEKGSPEYEAAREKYFELQSKYSEVISAQSGKTSGVSELEYTLDQLSNDKIALMDANTALAALIEITEKYESATDVMSEARAEAILNLDRTFSTFKALGIEFDETIISGLKAGIEENYKSEATELYATFKATYDNLYSQIKRAQADAQHEYDLAITQPTNFFEGIGYFGNYISAEFQGGFTGKSVDEIWAERAKKSSGMDKIDEELNKLEARLYAKSVLIGEAIPRGVAKGIEDLTPEAIDAIRKLTGFSLDKFKKENKINSPSKLYENLAGFIPDGIALGIQKGIPDVTSAVSELSAQMEKKMQGLSVEVPVYTAEDVNRRLASPLAAVFGIPQTQQQVTHKGADSEAVSEVGQTWNSNGIPLDVNVNVQSYVELDGDQVGEATTRYQQRQMAYSNGY